MPPDGASRLPSRQVLLSMEQVSHQVQILISKNCLLSTRVPLVEVVQGARSLELLDLLPDYLLSWRPAREGKPPLEVVVDDLLRVLGHLLLNHVDALLDSILWSLDNDRSHDSCCRCKSRMTNLRMSVVKKLADFLFYIFQIFIKMIFTILLHLFSSVSSPPS